MIPFRDFMVESLTDKYDKTFLIKTFDEFMEYFASSQIRKNQLMTFCELTGLFADIDNYNTNNVSTTDDFYLLYKLAEQQNLGAPVVGEYKGSNKKAKNKFALRRWVYNKADKWEEMRKLNGVIDRKPIDCDQFLLYRHTRACNTGFNEFHDTSLIEDGVNGTKKMSGQDFESVIATYYNYRYCNKSNTDHDKNITVEFIMSDLNCSKVKAEEVLSYIINESKTIDSNCDNLVSLLNGKGHGRLLKLVGSRNSTSLAWRKLGNFTSNPMSTPKTDLITEDGKIRISMKDFKGSQAMSGAQNEAIATIKTALLMYINEVGDTDETQLLQNELNIFLNKEWGKHKSVKSITQLRKENNEEILAKDNDVIWPFNTWLDVNVNSNKIFKKHLLLEALTGKCKFLPYDIDPIENPDKLIEQLSKPESLSRQEANYVFVWSDKPGEKSYIKPITEYIDSVIDKIRVYVRWKSSGNNHNVALSIGINK